MPRPRPVHRLTPREAELAAAIASDEGERARSMRLKAKIEAFWRARGYAVTVQLCDGPFENSLREARVDLRSDLVDGLPKGGSDDA
jgi:muconolactone delta-isomerase